MLITNLSELSGLAAKTERIDALFRGALPSPPQLAAVGEMLLPPYHNTPPMPLPWHTSSPVCVPEGSPAEKLEICEFISCTALRDPDVLRPFNERSMLLQAR